MSVFHHRGKTGEMAKSVEQKIENERVGGVQSSIWSPQIQINHALIFGNRKM